MPLRTLSLALLALTVLAPAAVPVRAQDTTAPLAATSAISIRNATPVLLSPPAPSAEAPHGSRTTAPDAGAFYAAILSTLGGVIEELELTLDEAGVVRRADPRENPLYRLVTVRRDAWPMSIDRLTIVAGEPETITDPGSATPTILLPLKVDIGSFVYYEPRFSFTQLLWEPSGNEKPTPLPDVPTPAETALAERDSVSAYVAELSMDRFEIRDGSFRLHRIFHERADVQEDIHEELVLENINVVIRNLNWRAEGASAELAPATISARLRTPHEQPTTLHATGHLVPEFEQFSFKFTGQLENLHLASLQPLIPYHAGIYLTAGVADVDFVAQSSANHLTIEHHATVRDAEIRQSDQTYNPLLSMATPLIKKLDEVSVDYTVNFTIGAQGDEGDFGKVYGRDIRKALERELGPKLAAGLTLAAPVTVVRGVFGIVQAPFRLFIGANRPKKPEVQTPPSRP